MRRSQPGSEASALLEQAGWVRSLARSLVAPDDVDDAVQSTWLAALEKPPLLRVSPRAWLRSVLRHATFRSSRRAKLRQRAEESQSRRPDVEPVDDVIQRAEVHQKLVDLVMSLDEPGRSTILMRYFDGLSLAEIARRLQVPAGTVRARHHRALEQLRARLGEEGKDWRLSIMPLAGLGADLGRAGAAMKAGSEVLIMTAKAKVGVLVGAILVVAVCTGGFLGRRLFDGSGFQRAEPNDAGGSDAGQAAGLAAGAANGGNSRAITPKPFQESDRAVLSGTVRGEDGGPIENARVIVVRYDLAEAVAFEAPDNPAGFPRVTTTGAAGEFRVEVRMGAPAFALLAAAPGYSPKTLTAWPARLTGPIEIVLEKGVVLDGTVQQLDRTPVPNAKVSLRWFAGGVSLCREGRSDAEGRYRVEGLPRSLEAMRYLLEATADGFAPQKLTYVPEADSTGRTHQDFFMTRGATIKGTVVDAETGAPLPAAHVVLWNNNEVTNLKKPDGTSLPNPDQVTALRSLPVRSDGTFVVEHVPSWGVHTFGVSWVDPQVWELGGVGAFAPGYASAVHPLDVPDEGSTVTVVLRCKPAAQIHGRVVDPEGHPIPGAHVSRSPDAEEDEKGWLPRGVFDVAPPHEVITDANGRYVVPAVPSSTRGRVPVRLTAQTVTWPAMRPAVTEVSITGSSDVEAPDLVLAPDFEKSAVVHVETEEGAPLWGAAVTDARDQKDIPLARTDREGRARVNFESIIKEPVYPVVVRAHGFAPESLDLVPQPKAVVEVTVVLHAGHSISGTVFYPDGAPAAGARVLVGDGARPLEEVFPATGSPVLPSATVSPSGSFEVADLPPGPWHLAAMESHDGQTTSSKLANVRDGASGIKLVLPRPDVEPCGRVEVTCTEKVTGQPVLKCFVALRNDERIAHISPASSPGEYVLSSVRAGEWRLRVEPSGFAPEERTIEVTAGGVTRVKIVAERGVTLRGLVKHPDGKTFHSPSGYLDGAHRSISISPEGVFEVNGLKPGSQVGVTVWDRLGPESSMTYLTRKTDFVAIPSDRSELAAEFPVVAAASLTIHVTGDRLFTLGRKQTEAQRDLLRRCRLEVRDSEGDVVLDDTDIRSDWGMEIREGRYMIRLEVPGFPAQVQTVQVSDKPAEVTFKVE